MEKRTRESGILIVHQFGELPMDHRFRDASGLPFRAVDFNLVEGTRKIQGHCPHCSAVTSFDSWPKYNDIVVSHIFKSNNGSEETSSARIGLRHCPNAKCLGIVIYSHSDAEGTKIFPSHTIYIDEAGLPSKIFSCLKEAVLCHDAGAYRASSLLVRRSLEEFCDLKGAVGRTLHDRIKDIGTKSVLPSDLIQAAQELRILGNDAAHLISKEYDDLESAHSEAAIMLAREIFKASYQYNNLILKLSSLKKT